MSILIEQRVNKNKLAIMNVLEEKESRVDMDEREPLPRLCFDILERIAIMAESLTLGRLICSRRVLKVIAKRRFARARNKLQGLFLTIGLPYNMGHYGIGVTLGYGSPVCYVVRRILIGVPVDSVGTVVDLYKRDAYGEYKQMIYPELTTLWM